MSRGRAWIGLFLPACYGRAACWQPISPPCRPSPPMHPRGDVRFVGKSIRAKKSCNTLRSRPHFDVTIGYKMHSTAASQIVTMLLIPTFPVLPISLTPHISSTPPRAKRAQHSHVLLSPPFQALLPISMMPPPLEKSRDWTDCTRRPRPEASSYLGNFHTPLPRSLQTLAGSHRARTVIDDR